MKVHLEYAAKQLGHTYFKLREKNGFGDDPIYPSTIDFLRKEGFKLEFTKIGEYVVLNVIRWGVLEGTEIKSSELVD